MDVISRSGLRPSPENLSPRYWESILFGCANDCDRNWDGRHLIGVYDGIHANLYNGEIEFIHCENMVKIKGHGLIADSMTDINKGYGHRIEFEELVSRLVD
mgnify:CR=1 FL=1